MNRRVLLVDDEPMVLESLRRQLADTFDVQAAPGPSEALALIEGAEPFAVVVSDMHMPVMTGAVFLEEVRRRSPDSVGIILTGRAELETTIAAVNQAHVFRFLTKPCRAQELVAGVDSGVEQYELLAGRRILLEQTLHGTVKMLTEILALTNPAAQQRANRIARYAEKLCAALGISIPWQLRIALMLSQIGCITLPEEILTRMQIGETLSDEAESIYRSHPALAARLLSDIPRLETVAEIVAHQMDGGWASDQPADLREWEVAKLGGAILKIATDLEDALGANLPRARALRNVAAASPEFPGDLRKVLESLELDEIRTQKLSVRVSQLRAGMVLDEDLYSTSGMLLLPKGQEVTLSILLRLQAMAKGVGVAEPFRVSLHG